MLKIRQRPPPPARSDRELRCTRVYGRPSAPAVGGEVSGRKLMKNKKKEFVISERFSQSLICDVNALAQRILGMHLYSI